MIELTIIGVPAPQGSKSPFGGESNPNTKPWRATVAADVAAVWDGRPLIDEPVEVDALFVFPRPKAHYRTGKNAGILRDDAPAWVMTKPDSDKLARAIGDSLTGVILRDDSRIVHWTLRKVYGSPARCELRISAADVYDAAA